MTGYDLVIRGEEKGPNVLGGNESPIDLLANYAATTRFTDLPPGVVDYARWVLLDTIGVILGGSIEPEASALAHRLGRQNGGPSTIIGHALSTSPVNAALVNGTAGTWLDYDSGHRPPPGKPLLPAAHPPVHLVPATLAVGELVAAPGPEILTALVVGYDAGARIGMATRLRAEIHPHGTYHNVGAAVAAARLKGFDREQIESTIGLAAHLSLMPSFENAYQGRTVRNIYAGVGSAVGIFATQLAIAGFTPEYNAISSIYGNILSPWLDPARITRDLGQRFEISQGFIKPYPMCRFGHPAVEAAETLVNRHDIAAEDIDTVEVETFDWAATLDDPAPHSDLGAKFSIPWAVATMLVRKSAGPDDFRDQALSDLEVRQIAARTTVRENPNYTAMTPSRRPASVTVRTKTGKFLNFEVERSSGGPDAPLAPEKVYGKFRSLADPVIGPEQAEAVADMVTNLHKLPDIRELTKMLVPGSHTLDLQLTIRPKERMKDVKKRATEGGFISDLIKFAGSISLESLPSSVVHAGRRTLVDTVGVIFAGAREPQVRNLAGQMAEESVCLCSTIFGSGYRAEAMRAALANATAGVWHEFDPGHRFIGGHPAIYAISAGLAVGEREGTSGKRVMEAIIAGYEVGARVGLGTTLRPGMYPHGSWPIVSAATTAGLLMGYSGAELREAINMSTSLNLGTSCKTAYEGATVRNIYAGFGAAMGVFAADLVGDGFTGERDGISTVFGSIAGEFFDMERALGDISRRWEITRGYHKLHACARCIHPALDALTSITKEQDIAPEQIERIDVFTFAMAATMNNITPETALAARFSMPYALAACLVLKDTEIAAYSDSALGEQRIRDLAAKVVVGDNPRLNARTPAELPATVRVELRDGRALERSSRLPVGEFDTEPLTDDTLSNKFVRLASGSLGPDNAEIVLNKLWRIETVPDVREITVLCLGGEE